METPPGKRETVLVVSQTFVPDPAAVGQHMSDVAFELARRGHDVRVYASARGYENPKAKYPRREMLNGADVRRFGFASFGKKSLVLRVLGTAMFMTRAFLAALFTKNLAGIFFSTSPPLIGLPLCIVGRLRKVPVVFWAMDLNPDQLIALRKLKATDRTAKVLEIVNRFILKNAALIIALDRFMADRLAARGISRSKMLVMPPWSHENQLVPTADRSAAQFRADHGLDGKFIIMYSGNHSPSNPLTTLLEAMVQLKDRKDLRFLFIGGGSGKKEVDAYIRNYDLKNALSLPYQPLADVVHTLSAAHVQVVSLGKPMVGIIHPCKVYGAMAVARPVLFLGPRPSHVSDLLEQCDMGIQISHGDVAGMVDAIDRLRTASAEDMRAMGENGRNALRNTLGQTRLCGSLCDAVEGVFQLSHQS
jgi:colanic acid biosynthesis glycosyl transferase WcaI